MANRALNASGGVLTTAMASGYQWIYAVFADADALDALNAKKNAKKRTVQQLVGFKRNNMSWKELTIAESGECVCVVKMEPKVWQSHTLRLEI